MFDLGTLRRPKNDWGQLKFFRTAKWASTRKKLGDLRDVYPPASRIFRDFELTPPEKVRVVVLGSEPYADGRATGLAFDETPGKRSISPAYRNIVREYCDDLGFKPPYLRTFSPWAENGVLLHNIRPTVIKGQPKSHANIGWEMLAYEIVSKLSYEREGIVWMLWGAEAQRFIPAIWNRESHCVISSYSPGVRYSFVNEHPSQSFLGSRPFSRACEYLGVDRTFWRLM